MIYSALNTSTGESELEGGIEEQFFSTQEVKETKGLHASNRSLQEKNSADLPVKKS